ncbi:MAG: hypothetical protein ACXVBI_17020, partial [Flavisolibacter sp.]
MASNSTYKFYLLVVTIAVSVLLFQTSTVCAQQPSAPADSSHYPISDRRGDPYNYPSRNPFELKDTGFVKRSIQYDPKTNQYYIIEKVGSQYYRSPATFSMEEFLQMQGQKDQDAYFRKRADLLSNLNRRNFKPKFGFSKDWVNRITGNGKVDIRPSGYVDMSAGYQGQNIK